MFKVLFVICLYILSIYLSNKYIPSCSSICLLSTSSVREIGELLRRIGDEENEEIERRRERMRLAQELKAIADEQDGEKYQRRGIDVLRSIGDEENEMQVRRRLREAQMQRGLQLMQVLRQTDDRQTQQTDNRQTQQTDNRQTQQTDNRQAQTQQTDDRQTQTQQREIRELGDMAALLRKIGDEEQERAENKRQVEQKPKNQKVVEMENISKCPKDKENEILQSKEVQSLLGRIVAILKSVGNKCESVVKEALQREKQPILSESQAEETRDMQAVKELSSGIEDEEERKRNEAARELGSLLRCLGDKLQEEVEGTGKQRGATDLVPRRLEFQEETRRSSAIELGELLRELGDEEEERLRDRKERKDYKEREKKIQEVVSLLERIGDEVDKEVSL
ncbi:uncharacterized protein CMU_022440 [Cryptosporidium muris RN66]|uniref:Uncharacterized protein n=1 Tax=Cryptosporidium muris (strain RN66) TaxID=441375 RepID=B6AK67_CRYMR|nr:uncharacterized protein CMU_022440 [Cryptosporidium muris RN66]EEA08608.1 hypothetical protein CMU_022440 [Cryptosporidium muris RN66]|eukprot:XP_002142957.1 hypothetical protein [Cryptosporidium muris RN66]